MGAISKTVASARKNTTCIEPKPNEFNSLTGIPIVPQRHAERMIKNGQSFFITLPNLTP